MKGQRKSMWGLRASSAVLAVAGTVALGLALATPASATIPEGTATITNPTTNLPLNSGASTDQFTVDLPAQAACAGDTATNGYHVFSYLVPSNVSPTAVGFTNIPKRGLGFFADGEYVGAINTAEYTGQIVSLPAEFTWSRLTPGELFSHGETTATWDGGIACANSDGIMTNYWNTEIVFKTSTTDAGGFTWSVTTIAPTSSGGPWRWVGIVLLIIALALLGLALARRRSAREGQRVQH
jgi:hypothetical protein